MDESPRESKKQPPQGRVGDRLDSWKEIAVYLKRGVRTVQRWEKNEGLPVYRHLHKKLGSVYADKLELDAWWHNQRPHQKRQGKTERPLLDTAQASIAVLPFVNLGPDKEKEYFSDGMTEELINAFSKVQGLRVVSSTSTFQFKGKAQNVCDIGEQLNVRTVLEGSVRDAKNRLRITARLIDVTNGYQLWSETYNREFRDVFAIQDEIARAIVSKLRIKLIDEQALPLVKPYTGSLEAYDLYLKGRHSWNQRTRKGFKKGIEHFQGAIEKDPEFALAHAGLADSCNMLGYYSYVSPTKVFPEAKRAALKALEIDDTLAEAHTSLAFVRMFYDWDWAAAEEEFKRALELKPEYATAHYWYGLNLTPLGRTYEAIAHVRKAQQLDPSSPIINAYVAGAFYFARQYDKAIEKCLRTLEMDPNFGLARLILGWAYRQKAMFEEAIAEFQKALTFFKGSGDALAALGHTFARSGRTSEARRVLEGLKKPSPGTYVSPGHTALVYLGLDQKDEALKWLQKAYQDRYAWLVFLKVDPIFDSLRSDPKFRDLVRRVRLEP